MPCTIFTHSVWFNIKKYNDTRVRNKLNRLEYISNVIVFDLFQLPLEIDKSVHISTLHLVNYKLQVEIVTLGAKYTKYM